MTKEEVRRLLGGRQYDRLLRLAEEEHRDVIGQLLAFLDAGDGLLRWRAIEGLGRVTGGLAQRDPEVGREIMGHLLESLRGEAGPLGGSAPEVIGEIIRNRPELFAGYVPELISLYEDRRLRRGVIWALGRIGKRRPDLVVSALPLLIRALEEPDPEIRGFAAWSLGEIAAQEAASALGDLRSDHETVTIYEAGKLWQRTVGAVALDALANIRARA